MTCPPVGLTLLTSVALGVIQYGAPIRSLKNLLPHGKRKEGTSAAVGLACSRMQENPIQAFHAHWQLVLAVPKGSLCEIVPFAISHPSPPPSGSWKLAISISQP